MAFPPIQPNTMNVGAPMGQAPGMDYPPDSPIQPELPPDPYADMAKMLDLFKKLKKESTEYRWVWEREWLRDLYYVMNRQWITFHPTRREWVDKRLQKWVPRPVTNKMAETLQAIRTNLGAINLAVNVRPSGDNNESMAAAEIANQMSPMIHSEHMMDQVMREADFWMIATGNACLQTSWDKDTRFNKVFVAHEQCMMCGQVASPKAIVDAGQHCPQCGNSSLRKAMGPPGPDGKPQPIGEWVVFGKGKTTALSPFEYAIPPNVIRFDELPYIIRFRWRDKLYYEANFPNLITKINWQKSPTDRSLQIFKSLALANDVGTGSQFAYLGASGAHTVEGVTEYELWLRPTPDYPQGLVLRVIGEDDPQVVPAQNEGLPGPIPYKDIEGNPIWPFCHAQYEHMGGRLYGRSALSPIIQKQDQLNQLDSMVQLCVQRMANPVWVIPDNAGVENITGEPGLVIKWNVLASGGNGAGKPERQAGIPVDGSLFEYRAQILKDIEDLSGAFDIIKGAKPAGVEAFSALNLLVERSQSRFTSVFQARGEMYRKWFGIALELERQFGPDERVWAVVGPNRGYTFQHFQNAQLQAAVSVQIEDGSNMPKTSLGKRAAVEQANNLMLLNPQDPDQRYALLEMFGLSDLSPSLNMHVQAALQMQDAFEKWAENPQTGPCPLTVKSWFDPHIHWVEHVKWLNTDKMRGLLAKEPALEEIVTMNLQALQTTMQMLAVQATPPGVPQNGPQAGKDAPGAPKKTSGGQAMANSNNHSGGTHAVPGGNAPGPNIPGHAQGMGPM